MAGIPNAIIIDLKELNNMGYTHYFRKENRLNLSAKEAEKRYQRAIKHCQILVRDYQLRTNSLSGYTAHTTPGLYGGVKVNGKGDLGHEDFVLREHYSQNDSFNFCKTAQKPYDAVVVACLIILDFYGLFRVSSDGSPHDWLDGLELARKRLKSVSIPIGDRAPKEADSHFSPYERYR
jgi:hypothetical protein